MNVDAKIAERVHSHFTAQGVPVLSVHDSFIIDYTRVKELKHVMAEASAAVVGRSIAVSASSLGLDEIGEEHRLDFLDWIQLPRSPAYLKRMEVWEGKFGREVVPYKK